MNATRHRSRPPPEVRRMAVWCDSARSPAARSPAARSAWWVLGAPALALPLTFVFVVAGAPGDWIGALWLVAVLWTVAASLVQALRAGFRQGDWSAFHDCALPHGVGEDHDWSTRSGRYAYLRIRDRHEALTHDGERYLQDHNRIGSHN